MGRIVFFIVLLGLLGLGAGVLYMGAFPPEPQTHQVQKVLPNSRFQPTP